MAIAMNSLFLVLLLGGCSAVWTFSVKPCDGNCNWYECHQESDKSIVCLINKKKGDNRPMKVKWTPSIPSVGNDVGFSYRSLHQFGYVMFSLDYCTSTGHKLDGIQKDVPDECNIYKCTHINGTTVRCKLVLCPGYPQGMSVYGDFDDWFHCIRQGTHFDCYIRPFDFSIGEECGKRDKGCKPGASKNIKGRWCSCGYGGVTYHCPKETQEDDDPDCRKERCSVGTTWREGKYLCKCYKDFRSECNVVNETVIIENKDTCSPRPEVCFPSENFTFGCSQCHCNHAGTFATCIDSDSSEHSQGPHLCRPDYRFSNGAMDCLCLQDGRSALCTSKPSISSGMMCSPRRYFPDKCNVCLCNSDGRSALCTVRYCSSTSIHHEGHVKSGKEDHDLY